MNPLIHIGYQKTGSTFLQFNVFNESYGFYNPFDRYSSEVVQKLIITNPFEFNGHQTQKYFSKKFRDAEKDNLCPVISAEDLSGHLVAYRTYEKEVSLRLKETFPEAKILIIVRKQQSIIKSAWRHYLRNKGPQPLSRFIGKQYMKDGFSPILRLDKLKYDLTVNQYQNLFGRENVLVLPFELLKLDQKEYIKKILEFSEVEPKEQQELYEPANLSPRAIELLVFNKLGFFMHKDTLGEKTYLLEKIINKFSILARLITPESVNKRIEKSWDTYIEEMTRDYYCDSNRNLSTLTGLDLANFGYDL